MRVLARDTPDRSDAAEFQERVAQPRKHHLVRDRVVAGVGGKAGGEAEFLPAAEAGVDLAPAELGVAFELADTQGRLPELCRRLAGGGDQGVAVDHVGPLASCLQNETTGIIFFLYGE